MSKYEEKAIARQDKSRLHQAVCQRNMDRVKIYSSMIDVNKTDAKGLTPLHLACSKGYTEIVKYLVEKKKAKKNVEDQGGNRPIHVACLMEHLHIVKYLVERCRVDVNVKNTIGYTPLHYASEVGCLDIVVYLLQHVSSKILKNDIYANLEQIALNNNCKDIVTAIRSFKEKKVSKKLNTLSIFACIGYYSYIIRIYLIT